MSNLKITSIVVTYNGMAWIKECLNSLINSNVSNHEIIVIDNNSTDGTVRFVEKHYPSVELILPGINLGFGKANNIGLQKALEKNCDYVFLINQDAWVEDDTLANLIDIHRKNSNYGIISPVHINKNQNIDRNFLHFVQEGGSLDHFIKDGLKDSLNELYKCDYINAAAWLMSRECLDRNGGFMPVFSHYGEDNNYCQRVINSGLLIGYTPGITVVHDRGERKRNYSLKNAYKRLYVEFLVIFTSPEKSTFLYAKSILSEFRKFFMKSINRPHKFFLAPFVLSKIFFKRNMITQERKISLRQFNNFI